MSMAADRSTGVADLSIGPSRAGCLRVLSLLCLVAASASAITHVVGARGLGVGTGASLVMAMVCLWCAAHLIRRPLAVRLWFATALMALAMIAVHVWVMTSGGHPGHVHGVVVASIPDVGVGAAMGITVLATGIELLVAVVGLWVATPGRESAG